MLRILTTALVAAGLILAPTAAMADDAPTPNPNDPHAIGTPTIVDSDPAQPTTIQDWFYPPVLDCADADGDGYEWSQYVVRYMRTADGVENGVPAFTAWAQSDAIFIPWERADETVCPPPIVPAAPTVALDPVEAEVAPAAAPIGDEVMPGAIRDVLLIH